MEIETHWKILLFPCHSTTVDQMLADNDRHSSSKGEETALAPGHFKIQQIKFYWDPRARAAGTMF